MWKKIGFSCVCGAISRILRFRAMLNRSRSAEPTTSSWTRNVSKSSESRTRPDFGYVQFTTGWQPTHNLSQNQINTIIYFQATQHRLHHLLSQRPDSFRERDHRFNRMWFQHKAQIPLSDTTRLVLSCCVKTRHVEFRSQPNECRVQICVESLHY